MKEFYAGAKKNFDGTLDLSNAAVFKPKAKQTETTKPAVRQRETSRGTIKTKADFFQAIENGGGSVEVQEARLRLVDLKKAFDEYRGYGHDDKETIEYYEREIGLTQRVVDGEKLKDVLNSMRSEEDKKRIEESRRHIAGMKSG